MTQTKQVFVRPFEFLRVAICASPKLREAGTPWHEQGSRKRCAARALPRVAACAATAVLTAVLARAEYFTLAPAGTTFDLSAELQQIVDELPS